MKLKDIFRKKEINLSKTTNMAVKIDKKELAKLTGGLSIDHRGSDASAGKGAKGA